MKKLIALILLLTLLTVTFSMIGCVSEIPMDSLASGNNEKDEVNEDEDQKENQKENQKDEKVYESIDFIYKGYVYNSFNLKFPAKSDVFILKSADELSAFDPDNVLNIKDKYTSEFFETKVLFFFEFWHRSSSEFIEFSAIIEKDGKLYPVMTGYENMDPYALATDDCIHDLHYAEMSRDDIADTGELLVINTYGEGYGIMNYKPLDGKIVKKEN